MARVRLRNRTAGEVLDLAFLFLKANACPFTIMGVLLTIPVSLLTYWLISLLSHWYAGWFVLAVMTPYYRRPFLVLCGEAMFEPRPSIRKVFTQRTAQSSWFTVRLMLKRLFQAATIVGTLHEWWTKYFIDEIIDLERVPGDAFQARAKNLHARLGTECHQYLLRHLLLGALFLASFQMVWVVAKMLFQEDFTFSFTAEMRWSYPVILAYWMAQIYFTVSEFLFYLNLRTIHEGWELFLQMRVARARLEAMDRPRQVA